MAMITPIDSIPTMIPPTDYPLDSPPGAIRERPTSRRKNAIITIEVRELYILTKFLIAFCGYVNARHTPEAFAEVMRRYRVAMSFYDGRWEGEGKKKKRRRKSSPVSGSASGSASGPAPRL